MPPSAPLCLHVEVEDLNAVFDARGGPSFLYSGRALDERLATHLENLVRERRPASGVEVEVALRRPSGGPGAEDAARRDLHAYFLAERQEIDLELRVNQREGWGFVRRAFPLMIGALAVAGVLYVDGPGLERSDTLGALVTALVYLLFITIVWVLLWDPTEKLLFDAYLLRSRIRALSQLERASVRFVQAPPPPGAQPVLPRGS